LLVVKIISSPMLIVYYVVAQQFINDLFLGTFVPSSHCKELAWETAWIQILKYPVGVSSAYRVVNCI